jgi:hypothetical protein
MATIIVREYKCWCRFCGVTFVSKFPAAKYCTNAHRQQIYRWRKRLPLHYDQSVNSIRQIEQYLKYDESRHDAVALLKNLKLLIREIEDDNNIKRVA